MCVLYEVEVKITSEKLAYLGAERIGNINYYWYYSTI